MHRARLLPILTLLAACDASNPEAVWSPAFDATATGWLLNVWGSGPDDLLAFGGKPEGGVVMRFDGDSWAPVDLGVTVPLLTWGHGFGPRDVTAVGFGGTILHHDGETWTIMETPTDENLWGVWGAAPDNLWAVGGGGREEGQATLLHWDGVAWMSVAIPPLTRANVWAWYKVWGTSADNVYVVGQRGAVLHYDGGSWTEQFVGASDDLISLWGTGPDNIVAVGGRASAVISRWDGESWTTEQHGEIPGLNGVWTRTPGTVHAVGSGGTIVTIDVASLGITLEPAVTLKELHGVFGAGDRLVAVGGNLLVTQAPYVGVALERSLGGEE